MMIRFLRLLAVAPICAAVGCQSHQTMNVLRPNDPTLGQLSWLAGSWITDASGDQPTINEEHWTQPGGATMLGMNRTIAPGREGGLDRTVFFEYLRIESTVSGVVYLASPKGRQPPTPFRMLECTASPLRVVFENRQQDFPKRIAYWRKGNELHARIDGDENGQPRTEEWTWRRARIE